MASLCTLLPAPVGLLEKVAVDRRGRGQEEIVEFARGDCNPISATEKGQTAFMPAAATSLSRSLAFTAARSSGYCGGA